jgi:hypothetical protein
MLFSVRMCVFVVIASTALAPGDKSQTMDFLIEPGKAGRFEIGMTVDEIYQRVGRDNVRLVDLFAEGMFVPVLQIRVPGSKVQPSITAEIREWPCAEFSIWRMSVDDPRFQTSEGLGVGSTLGEMRQHHRVEAFTGEGAVVAFVKSMNLSFILDAAFKPTDLSKVKSVLLVPQPKEVRKRRCPDLGPLP